jgi:hypothetical protein
MNVEPEWRQRCLSDGCGSLNLGRELARQLRLGGELGEAGRKLVVRGLGRQT